MTHPFHVEFIGISYMEPPRFTHPDYPNNYLMCIQVHRDNTAEEVKIHAHAEAVDAELPEGISIREIGDAFDRAFTGNPDAYFSNQTGNAWFLLAWIEADG